MLGGSALATPLRFFGGLSVFGSRFGAPFRY
jgi:hypothetical protein